MGERPYGPMHIIIIRIISYQHITRKKTQEKEKKINNKTNQVMSYCWLKRKVMCHIKREDSFSPSKSFPIKKKIQINQYISLKFHPSSSSSIRKNLRDPNEHAKPWTSGMILIISFIIIDHEIFKIWPPVKMKWRILWQHDSDRNFILFLKKLK